MGGSSKSVTVGYKYYVGMHMVLCHGMVDKILRIRVDKRDAWLGSRTNGRITIDKPSLFGGESREGGIVGAIDFENGNSAQTPNDYLVSKLGSLVPAFRGVAGVVLRQVYLGMNPYLKNWDFRIQRIHYRQNGELQWYNEKAEILVPGKFKQLQAFYFALDISGSMTAITSNGQTRLFNAVTAIKATLDMIDTLRIDSGLRVDIHVTAWSQTGSGDSITQYNVNTATLASLKTWLDGLSAGGGTDFRQGVVNVAGFFGAVSEEANRVVLFITDGEPNAPQDEVAAEAAATLFTTPDIQSFGFNIDLPNTTYTAVMDNTSSDGVPVLDGSDSEAMANAIFFAAMGDSPAMNPAHIIRECLTDQDWGMGYADGDIDDVSFMAAADKLHAESMGISLLWDTQTSIEEFVKEIVRHIDAALFVDRATGKFVLKLIRDDFDEEDLITLDESNIDKITDFKRPTFGELINAVTVTYWDVNSGEDSTLTISDIALAQQQGNTNLSSIKYPGFVTADIASRVAQRDLKQLSTPLASCTIYANLDAEPLNIGSVFKLTWPDYDISNLTMRVTGIAYGDGKTNRVRIQCAQDVFALPSQAYVTPSEPEWTDPIQAPIPITNQVAFEVPYLELVQVLGQSDVDSKLAANADAGYVAAAAGRPQESAISARFLTDSGAGYAEVSALDFCPVATLAEEIDKVLQVFSVSDFSDFASVTAGTWAQVDDELIAIVSFDETSLTVKRGVLDTVPQAHATGAKIYFWDAYSVADESEYVASDSVDVKLLTVTGMGELSLDAATAETVVMNSRAIRPYPPGNLKICGVSYPATIGGAKALSVSWAHRDRTQQTSSEIYGATFGNIGPEAGTTYNLRIFGETDTLLRDITGLTGTSYEYPLDEEIDESGLGGSSTVSTGVVTWTVQTVAAFGAGSSRAIAHDGAGMWVAGSTIGGLFSSPDGLNWTSRTSPFTASAIPVYSVAYGGGLFVAVGSSSTNTKIATSPDGITWTDRGSASLPSSIILTVGYGNGYFIIGASNGDMRTSTNGISWSSVTSSFSSTGINAIAYGGGVWVAVGNSGKLATSTSPSSSWTQRTSSFGTSAISGIAYGGGIWVATGADGKIATASTPTSTWTQRANSFSGSTYIGSVAFGDGRFVAVGGANGAGTSTDGITWSSRDLGLTTEVPLRVAYGNGLWVVGAQNTKFTNSPEFVPSDFRPNGTLRIELESVRDGFACFQQHNYSVVRNGDGFNNGIWEG